MVKPAIGFLVLVAAIATLDGTVHSQGPRGQIEEVTLLDNESMRAVLLTYAPGADSDLHLNVCPEVTIVQEGEVVLYTATGGREVLRAGTVHWLPESTVHLARNEGTRPARFISLLLKKCG